MNDIIELDEHRKKGNPTNLKFSKTRLEALRFETGGPSTQYVWDTEVLGLGIRLYPTGAKTFWLAYRNEAGKKKFLKLGTFQVTFKKDGERHIKGGSMTVRQARDEAKKRLGEIVKGIDPVKQRNQARKRDSFAKSVSDIARRYIDEYAKAKRKTWRTDERRLFPVDKNGKPDSSAPIYRLHDLEFNDELSREDLEDELRRIHTQIGQDTPTEANRVASLVNAALNWAVRQRLVSGAFIDLCALWGREPRIWFEEGSRDDHLRVAELKPFAEALAGENQTWRAIVMLTLLTGARQHSEVQSLLWKNVRFDVGEFTYTGIDGDGTKNGSDHTLPMTKGTRAILKAIPQTSSPYVFHSDSQAGYFGKSKRLYPRIRKRKKKATRRGFADHITAHALRHTFSTIAQAKLELSDAIVRTILNQRVEGMGATYTHMMIDDMADALGRFELFVLNSMGIDDLGAFIEKGEL